MDKKLLIQKRNERYRGLYNASEKVTNINRTLSIAGIAQVWLFLNYNPSIDERNILFVALCLFVSSIILEYIHYIIEVIIKWLYSGKLLIKETSSGKEIRSIPNFALFLSWSFWVLKIIVTLAGYSIVGYVIFKIIFK